MGESLPTQTLIKQPVNQDIRVENGVLQLTERWKGQYEHCRTVAKWLYSTGPVWYTNFTAHAGTLSAAYSTPTPPTDYSWQFAQATVDECEAGENAFLQIIWNSVPSNEYEGSFEDWPVQETWNLQWQPENYDVYAYCANPSTHNDGQAPIKSQRVAVEQCLHPPIGNNVMTQNKLFIENNGLVKGLNANEQKILKWKLEGKHVIKHHPLLTQIKTWTKVPQSKLAMILNGVSGEVVNPDIVDVPEFQMNLQGYTWVSQGSNVQSTRPDTRKNEYTIALTTSWVGAIEIVPEFYSNNPQERWEFGQE